MVHASGQEATNGAYATWTETELIELYEEMAAIREFDGGMDSREAEQAAYWDLRKLVGRERVPESVRELGRKFKPSTRLDN